MSGLPFSWRRALCCAVLPLAALLSACSPDYNWRELTVADGQVQAIFPARASTESRDLPLGNQKITFSLTTATVGDALFAVGYAPLPPAAQGAPGMPRQLGETLVRSLYANLGVEPPLPLTAFGEDIRITGRSGVAGRAPPWLLARVWVTDRALIEVVAMGTAESLTPEHAAEFVRAASIKR
ncbi:MAG: hypothetical protein ABW210_11825 [Achromobacter sp.]